MTSRLDYQHIDRTACGVDNSCREDCANLDETFPSIVEVIYFVSESIEECDDGVTRALI